MDGFVAWLRDPMARTILAFLSLCAAIALFLIGQWWWRRKALTYRLSETRLLTVHEELKSRVEILFGGLPANDVCLIVLTLNNSGSEAIRAADFERPVIIDCG